MDEATKSRLINQLYEIGVIKFGEFQLKAGGTSPIYIDMREIISHPKLLKELAEVMSSKMKDLQFDNVCGVPYGALALASVVCVFADAPMVMCRKEEKEHGTKKRIDGKYANGETCLIIEDVVTTGSSIIETAGVLRNHGLVVKDALVILDREQSANERLAQQNIRYNSILKLSDLTAHLPKDLDPALREKVEQYLKNRNVVAEPVKSDKSWNPEQRRTAICHPTARRLFDIMLKKKSNLCVAADMTTSASILQLARDIGSHLCALKLHADIIEDFTIDFALELKKLASDKELDFLILEDRKFADTGNVVDLQTRGVHQLSSWVDAFTVHGVSGPGVFEGLKKICVDKQIACFLVAQMSSEKNLLDENYQKGVLHLATAFPEVVAGFICQKRVVEDPRFLFLSPGVHLNETTDNLGQQWRSPEDAVCRDKVDVLIVGRGVINDSDRKGAVEKYRKSAWDAFTNRK